MDQSTLDTFTRRTADLLDRRSLFGGASAALLALAGMLHATEAKKHHHKHHKHKKSKGCKKRVKACREALPIFCEGDESCIDTLAPCCKKACKSLDKVEQCCVNVGVCSTAADAAVLLG